MIVKTRGRAWFTGVIGGTKAQLAINDVSTDLPLDSIVTEKAARDIERDAKAFAPVDTGNLRASSGASACW